MATALATSGPLSGATTCSAFWNTIADGRSLSDVMVLRRLASLRTSKSSKHPRRMDPITRSTYARCHGDRGNSIGHDVVAPRGRATAAFVGVFFVALTGSQLSRRSAPLPALDSGTARRPPETL